MEQSYSQKTSWYNNSTYLLLACILLFPLGLYGIWRSDKVVTWVKVGYTAIVAYFLFGNIFTDAQPTQPLSAQIESSADTTLLQDTTTLVAEPPIDPTAILREEIQTELDYITRGYEPTDRRDKVQIFSELSRFAIWGKLIKRGERSEDDEAKALAKKLATKLAQIQRIEFPKLRKSYAKSIEHDLWRENIKIVIKGSGSTTLELIGGTFASNRNIESFQQALGSVMRSLRFKRVNYKFIKNDREYTYYTITSDADGEIMTYL